jgi:transketolase C-terminal domain/subunit
MVKGGSDVCIISYGPIMGMAFAVAAKIQQEKGRSVAVVSAHTLKPLDATGIADLLQRFKSVLVIEEHSERGGLGAQVKQIAWEIKAGCHLSAFGLKDEFIHVYGAQRDLWQSHGLSVDRIYERAIRD